ncbi:MAG: RluA family pseudouridine synthase [Parachlamydia sp.]|nr:RluA family pseudouridine synthase [Parachlamydia sp.]
MQPEEFVITEEEAGERLDKILARRYSDVRSRTYFQDLIEDSCVLLNGEPVKKRVQPKAGDEVEIAFRLSPELELKAEAIPLEILYEDDDLLAVNKSAGMVVHPAVGNWSGTFVNALLHYCKQLEVKESLRPGIVHRLDKETTGVLLAAKTTLAQQRLIALFSSRSVYKEYLAICVGNPGVCDIEAPIGRHPVHRRMMAVLSEGGRAALSRCRTLAFDGQLAVVSIVLVTGRTHQIRVHMKHRGTPVLGDPLYGSSAANQKYAQKLVRERQMLHAWRVSFAHPMSGKIIELEAPVPPEMAELIDKIQKRNIL